MSFDPNSNAITTDPEYLLNNPSYIKQAHDRLVQYGILPPADGSFGTDAATQAEVAANPYSVAALLKNSYSRALSTNNNVANAHGALFSGAAVNNQLHSLDDYQHGISTATQNLQGELGTIGGNRNNTIVDIWKRLSQATDDVAPNPTPDTTPSIGGSAGAPAIGGREADRPGPVAAQPNPWHIPGTNGVALAVRKPVMGGIGHQT